MRLSLFLIASAAFAASSTVAAEPIKVPLFRRHNDDSGIVHADAERLDNGVLGGKVHIGTPPQEFTFAFDTSTGYSWVRGSRCKSENCLDRCTYYARRSETAVSTGKVFKVKYGNSCVDTKIYLDTFEFGGLTVTDMPFGGAYRMSGFDHGFDGYLGLGRSVNFNKSSAYTSSARTSLQRRDDLPASAFVTNAYQQGTGVESAQFGMYTTSTSSSGFDSSGAVDTTTTTTTAVTNATATTTDVVASATTTTASAAEATSTEITSGGFGFVKRTNKNEPAGYLVIGGVDKSVIDGDIYYFDVVDNDESESSSWDVPITKVKFGNELAIEQRPKAVASFSTSEYYIAMPADQADIYHEYFGGKVLHSTGTYKVKCSKIKDMPPLKLELGDYVVQIPAKYWTRVIDADSDCCATRIRRGESYRDWVLGTTFTNLFYTTFDPVNEKVGIALVKGHENDGIKVYKKD